MAKGEGTGNERSQKGQIKTRLKTASWDEVYIENEEVNSNGECRLGQTSMVPIYSSLIGVCGYFK